MRDNVSIRLLIPAAVMAAAFVATFTDGGDGRIVAQEQKKKEDAKPVSIAKDEIYTTSGEKGFKEQLYEGYVSGKDGKPKPAFSYTHDLKVICSHSMGASNIFMVRGNDIKQAVHGTRLIFALTDSADTPPDRDIDAKKIESEKFWVVVYLGSGWSGPPKWLFKSATIQQKNVEFQYYRPRAQVMATTADIRQYFYWLPLDGLKKGTYRLNLVDADKGHPVLTRYVDVP